jgi:hypothetical protein
MTRYQARMLDSVSGAEGAYTFEHRDDLMDRPADDIVAAFFEYAEREVFSRHHVEYELNGVLKNKAVKTVVAIGSLHMRDHDHPTDNRPFTLFISAA